jgi:hypothetical protein
MRQGAGVAVGRQAPELLTVIYRGFFTLQCAKAKLMVGLELGFTTNGDSSTMNPASRGSD